MNGVLVCEGKGTCKNIGDYILSIAQFFEKTDCFVKRKEFFCN